MENENLLRELSFISGSWSGEGFVVDFTEPVYTMIFGSMQAANEQGEVMHWETFRFELKDNNIFLYPAQRGVESGTYIWKKNNESDVYMFQPFINTQVPIKEIYFQEVNGGNELVFGVRGKMEDQPFEKEWHLKKRV